ncbi:MAG: GNAT family N-acetyltransferase [Silicimonas sp.]|nr:GNAT family N-acetyltransferase [Silicimonas sp.]
MPSEILTERKAKVDDLPALLDLQARAFRGDGARDYGTDRIRAILSQVTMVNAALLAEGRYFVICKTGDTPVACGGWSRELPAYSAVTGESFDELPAIVRAVHTDPSRTRQGLARRIMALIEADARCEGVERLTLTATLPGVPLYAALGYAHVGPRLGVLPDGTPVSLADMEKRLATARGWAATAPRVFPAGTGPRISEAGCGSQPCPANRDPAGECRRRMTARTG